MDAIDTGDYARSLHVPLIQISQDAHHGDYDYKQRANQDKVFVPNCSGYSIVRVTRLDVVI